MLSKNKGMLLENIINLTILEINKTEQGIFHKLDVPIAFGKVNKEGSALIVEKAYIARKSTTDYYGMYKGRFVAFEAKSTSSDSLPLSNIHEHQWQYILRVDKLGGIAFFVIGYMKLNRFFVVDKSVLQNLATKSLKLEDAVKYGYELQLSYPGKFNLIDYLMLKT